MKFIMSPKQLIAEASVWFTLAMTPDIVVTSPERNAALHSLAAIAGKTGWTLSALPRRSV